MDMTEPANNIEPINVTYSDEVIKNAEDFPQLDNEHNKMLTDAAHEIVAELTISIISKTEDPAAMPSTKQMYINSYHIPVPSGHDEEEYAIAFIQYLEQSMGKSL